MKVLTYTSYKEHCDLYTEIQSSVAVNNCQIKLAEKDILLSTVSIILYRAGARTGVETKKLSNLISQCVLIQLMILTQNLR